MAGQSEYFKTYEIGLTLNDSDLNSIKNELVNLKLDKIVASKDVQNNISKQFTEMKKQLVDVKNLEQQIAVVRQLGATEENLKYYQELVRLLEEAKQSASGLTIGGMLETDAAKKAAQEAQAAKVKEDMTNFKTFVLGELKKGIQEAGKFLKKSWKSAISTISEMASFSLGSSLTINAEAREQAMRYGLSDEQNYALTKVKKEMGIETEEDMFYMNENQRERFAERMGYYTSQYQQMANEDFFESWQETQITIDELKQEFIMTIAKFIVDNKDLIKSVLDTGISFMKWVMKTLSDISSALGYKTRSDSEKAAATNAILSNVSNVKSSNTTNNLSMSPQYNVYGSDITKIQENDRLYYEQLYAAYNNG